jgi:hypothetical protein
VILTGYKRGRRRDENDRASVGNNRRRRRSVRATLGCGEKRRDGERSGEARGWCSPFIVAGEGHTGARKGETVGDLMTG